MAGILIWLIDTCITLYTFILIARAFLPLVGADPYTPVTRFIYRVTEPLLAPLRRWTVSGNYDFSPVVVVLGLMAVRQILLQLVYALF